MNKSIKVGIDDWSGFTGDNGFYPQDLPNEWRLSYYSNEFESACIHLDDESLDSDLLLEWTEDLPETFELSFQLSDAEQLTLLKQLVQIDNLRIQYLVLDDVVKKADKSELFLQLGKYKSVLLTSEGQGPSIVYRSDIWTPDRVEACSELALMPRTDSVQQSRLWIEQWLSTNESDNSMTLWCNPSTSHASLTELRTLVELMGY